MNFKLIMFICLFSANLSAQDKLIFALDIIRHGDRTPIKAFPNSDVWTEGLGQLTALGMEQEYMLGRKLRSRYILDKSLLPAKYKNHTLYVRSTDYDRTLMSAQFILMGLYPTNTSSKYSKNFKPNLPIAYVPIPIHTISKNQDELIPYHMENKEWINSLFIKHSYSQKEWIDKTEKISPKFDKWSQIIEVEIKNLRKIANLGDTLYIYNKHKVKLPFELPPEDITEIIQDGKWALTALFTPKKVGATLGNELLSTVTNYLEEACQKKSSLKFVLFSGHDTSILSIFSALQAPLDQPPAYASDLSFELYETKEKNHYVKISLNDESTYIPYCCGNTCSIKQLKELLNEAKTNKDKSTLSSLYIEN